ncbi:hypothetical protein ABIB50_001863 [Mucilaginibacter sp. UYCu711]
MRFISDVDVISDLKSGVFEDFNRGVASVNFVATGFNPLYI